MPWLAKTAAPVRIQQAVANPSETGKEAVIALMAAGDFLGEGCISSGAPVRMATATTMAPTIAVEMKKNAMIRVLHEQTEFADRFISYMLKRNVRIEADLVDQLFNSIEKRLARALLLLARYGKEGLKFHRAWTPSSPHGTT